MHFLCLHGAIGNTDTITIQLAPLLKELNTDNSATTFHYLNGPLLVSPPPGFEAYFGVGPHYRWIDDGQKPGKSTIRRVRDLPTSESNDDAMREVLGDVHCQNYADLMDYIEGVLEKNPEIGGMIAYSEGAAAAATYILDEQRRHREDGRKRQIKCAMFVGGWPAMRRDTKGFILADDGGDEMIDIPTLHVLGANDPYRYGSEALFETCDPDAAEFFDMGKGHTLPRSGLVISELAQSSQTLSAQLGPLQKNLAADNTASFYCVNAPHATTAPGGYIEYFGHPPHYRWLNYVGVGIDAIYDTVRGARSKQHATPEDTFRSLIPPELSWVNYEDVLRYIEETLEKNPDIEGLLGYSEGATVGAAYILREQMRKQKTGRTRQIKCAIFLAGIPPVKAENGFIFADEQEEMIDLPTVHIVGANDPFRIAADCLYNICDPDSAYFFDTGKGHTIPRGGPVIDELGDTIRELIQRTREGDE
ncbi:DUF341 family oxidoreductase [Aspergillus vadensis CBS 113365]|uniref:DUF341 family oxidoreductase n=1 Tax=Aspergillus vadensis (strain CBS 113365 / IMI 142717 / IBT 24658) TaxID=1448311 RepID=A0A319C6S1_ASPVC|nr:DUF341 family oxidoreductase [Aspergillus vadensis CBS 113365]PYH71008.1 DUF341 family oxidoreductase [Aspergillus vadensis CBS 113365]